MSNTRMTSDDVRMGRARLVCRGGYYFYEWAPRGTQLKVPMKPAKRSGPGA